MRIIHRMFTAEALQLVPGGGLDHPDVPILPVLMDNFSQINGLVFATHLTKPAKTGDLRVF